MYRVAPLASMAAWNPADWSLTWSMVINPAVLDMLPSDGYAFSGVSTIGSFREAVGAPPSPVVHSECFGAVAYSVIAVPGVAGVGPSSTTARFPVVDEGPTPATPG